jgi:hypothetical protein
MGKAANQVKAQVPNSLMSTGTELGEGSSRQQPHHTAGRYRESAPTPGSSKPLRGRLIVGIPAITLNGLSVPHKCPWDPPKIWLASSEAAGTKRATSTSRRIPTLGPRAAFPIYIDSDDV